MDHHTAPLRSAATRRRASSAAAASVARRTSTSRRDDQHRARRPTAKRDREVVAAEVAAVVPPDQLAEISFDPEFHDRCLHLGVVKSLSVRSLATCTLRREDEPQPKSKSLGGQLRRQPRIRSRREYLHPSPVD